MIRRTLIVAIGFLMMLGLKAQSLEPTSTEALVKVTTVNSNGEPKQGEKISFTSASGEWSVVTNDSGCADLLVPKGASYTISYMTLEGENDYSEIEIPDADGKVQFELRLEYEQPKVYTLKNVKFETGSSRVKSSSYPYLDQLVELLEAKPSMRIEIGGHTDNVGDPKSNEVLSENRASAVKTYLLNKGIAEHRVEVIGYGQSKPIANNDLVEGRRENRRTEVRILEE